MGVYPIRCDLAGNDTRGGVVIYHKQDLLVKHRVDLDVPSYTLVLELSIFRKKVFFILSYRKFGQMDDDFKLFSKKLDELMDTINLENPFITIVTGYLNSHHHSW